MGEFHRPGEIVGVQKTEERRWKLHPALAIANVDPDDARLSALSIIQTTVVDKGTARFLCGVPPAHPAAGVSRRPPAR